MSVIAKPYTFSPNTTISSSQVNANFDTLYNDYNGGIAAANLATGAVTTAKIADSNVTTAKIADDNVTAAKIDWAATGSGAGIWWEELGRTTLGSTADTISVASLAARKYLKILVNLQASGQISAAMTLNNDTGSNYALRVSADGGADGTAVSQSSMGIYGTVSAQIYAEMYVTNISAQEKIIQTTAITRSTAGAANAPSRRDIVAKWANTSAQISRVDFTNGGTGDYASGTEVIVLGHD